MRYRAHLAALLASSALFVATPPAQQPLAAQQTPPTITAADYVRAEKFLSQATAPLVLHGAVRPTWLPDGRFWYRNAIAEGAELIIVDPQRGTRERLLDQPKVAAALSAAADTTIDPYKLPVTAFELLPDGQSVQFGIGDRRFLCDVRGQGCTLQPARAPGAPAPQQGRPNAVPSPDRKKTAFIRDYNLWVRDVASGKETQLTTDGVKDFGYATDNAGWTHSDAPILLWSPDSRRIATFQQDERNVGMMYLVNAKVGHPTLQAWRYPLPGDSVIQMIQRVVIDLGDDGGSPRVLPLKMPPDPHRSSWCDHIACRGIELADAEWYPDGSHLAFVSTSRDHKREVLRIADAATGDVRDVYTETAPTQFESGTTRANWHVMPATNEFIWFSERDNWGRLYLYDLRTGRLKNTITPGDGTVLGITLVNERTRTVYFTATGRERGRDPYFRHLYRVTFEGRNLQLLTPEDADHDISMGENVPYFVDSYSRPEVPSVSLLRDGTGRTVLTLEKADISRLLATGWTPPTPFTVKARDRRTDLYGLMFRPTQFDSTRKYPIVNNIYPGPQTGSVGSRSFVASRGDTRALAELGFVVVQLDAMGTPTRSKSFHDAYYGNMGDNGLPDQVTAMKQLAQRYPWIDMERAGIYGHSGGGYAAADAMLRYPDVFRVGISEAGNHDNREYEDDWGERYQGLLKRNPDGTTNYDNQANQLVAKNLKGRLLIAYGTTDDNVPPYNSLLLLDELIRANKDFDVLPLPNRRHGFGGEPYMVRRRWDYFVQYLMGAEPPKEYQITAAPRAIP